jgi:hypothetical protein
MTTKIKAIMGLGLVAGLGAAVLPLSSYAADTDSDDAEVRVVVDESITITGINNTALGLNFSGADISNGTLKTGAHAVTVSTSAATGYTLTMKADHNDLKKQTSTSPNVYGGASGFSGVGDASADYVAPAPAGAYGELTLASGKGFTFADDAPATGVWGFRLAGFAGADEYATVPTTALVIAESDVAQAAKVTTVSFGAQAGTTTPAGTYGAWIEYLATTK